MVVGDRHRGRRHRWSHSCRAKIARASPFGRGRRPPPRACRPAPGQNHDLAFAACKCDPKNSCPARFARLRPRLGRPFLLWRWNLAERPCRAARNAVLSGAFGVQPRGGEAQLEPARLLPHVAAWTRLRADYSGAATQLENPVPVMGRDDAAAPCKTPLRERPRPIADRRDGGDGRANGSARGPPPPRPTAWRESIP